MVFKKIFLCCLIIAFFFLFLPASVHAAAYYVPPDGSGTTCSLTGPCSLNTGLGKLSAGDTLYLRGGTYNQTVGITKSGTASAPITIDNYQNETVIIDGNYTIPSGTWSPLVNISGSYVIFKDIEITRSNGEGVQIVGSFSKIINIYTHHNHEAGVIMTGDDTVADGCRVYYNSMHNE